MGSANLIGARSGVIALLFIAGMSGCSPQEPPAPKYLDSDPTTPWEEIFRGTSPLGAWTIDKTVPDPGDLCTRLRLTGEEPSSICGPAPSLKPDVNDPIFVDIRDPQFGDPSVVFGVVAPEVSELTLVTARANYRVTLRSHFFVEFPPEHVTAFRLRSGQTVTECPVRSVDGHSPVYVVDGCRET